MKPFALLLLSGLLLGTSSLSANSIGFVEKFSLAEDRTVPLTELIPGTREYYFFHCLHAQNKGDHQEVERLLKLWLKRHGNSSQIQEIQNRGALLRHQENSDGAYARIRGQLNLNFNHSRIVEGRKPTHPTELNPDLISFESFRKRAFARHSNLRDMEDRGLLLLAPATLNETRLRDYLNRIRRPDIPKLSSLVHKDLQAKYSRGFGSLAIHRNLTRLQLDELLRIDPKLLLQANFVHAYLSKLTPSGDVDPEQNPTVKLSWLNDQLRFVRGLAPAFNTLKANVLYHLLRHKRSQGEWDRELFMEYLALPRSVHYLNPKWRDLYLREHRNGQANLGQDYRPHGGEAPIGNDLEMVRSHLLHFLVKDEDYEAFSKYVVDTFLKPIFAEAKLTSGQGDPEKWFSLINSSQVKALKERVDLDFAHDNSERFSPGENVKLKLYTKNVKELLVKEFEINAFNYYLKNGAEVNTGIELDGLAATREQTVTYEDPPMRRILRNFAFNKLKKRGVYVVEFIGNGISSRTLIRKGTLRLIEKVGPAGHEFRILDEENQACDEATLWLEGKEYEPDDNGVIRIPFSNRPGHRTVILRDGDFASLSSFRHLGESYELRAGLYVDREALLQGRKATLLVRPSLRLNGYPTSLELLEEAKLVLLTHDHDGSPNRLEVPIDKFDAAEEFTYEFSVPERLHRLQIRLEAKVENLSQARKQNLSDSASYAINAIDHGANVDAVHLGRNATGYTLEILGKNGEAIADRPVQVNVKHRAFRNAHGVALKSDKNGRVLLGRLPGVESIDVRHADGTNHRWPIHRAAAGRALLPVRIHATTKDVVRLPLTGPANGNVEEADALSLLERRGGGYAVDHLAKAEVGNGFAQISDLPPGDYELYLKDAEHLVHISVTGGDNRFGFATSRNRILERKHGAPLQITGVAAEQGKALIRVAHATPFTRVHVFASRYLPRFDAHSILNLGRRPSPYSIRLSIPRALYVAERDIGEEYRYVLERRSAAKFPGNMLTRAGLILNPWAVRDTHTATKDARAGGQYARLSDKTDAKRKGEGAGDAGASGATDYPNLDFLSQPSLLAANLNPDENGLVELDLPEDADPRFLRIVAADPVQLVTKDFPLPETPLQRKELRMATDLDPAESHTRQKRVEAIQTNQAFELADFTTARFRTASALADAYEILLILNGNATLREFSFLLLWPSLDAKEKDEKYAKYACHELHFFLYRKDPKFFARVVKPYLANKKEPTFLDDWFLERDLDKYLDPRRFALLNAFEKILLARRLPDRAASMARYVREKWELIPPNPEQFDRLFEVALQSAAFSRDDKEGDSMAMTRDVRNAMLKGSLDKFNSSLGLANSMRMEQQAAADRSASLDRIKTADAWTEVQALPAAPPAEPTPRPTSASAAAEKEMEDEHKAQRKSSELKKMLNKRLILEGALAAPVDNANFAYNAPGGFGGGAGGGAVAGKYFQADLEKRGKIRSFYRKLGVVKEWAESNYYRVTKARTNANLVPVNAFWRDYAAAEDGPFLSGNFLYATSNFTEMALALAVLDLPFEAPDKKTEIKDRSLTITPEAGLIVFHEQLLPAEAPDRKSGILISQRFYRLDSRYRYENGERLDNFVDDEFLPGTAYGGNVVLTNPTSSRRKLRLLLHLPNGSMPLNRTRLVRSIPVTLEGYSTRTFDYSFYFPTKGEYLTYPARVAEGETAVAGADAFVFNVVEKLTRKDKGSWQWISQNGSDKDVLRFLRDNNLNRHDLALVAFRLRHEREGGSGRAFYEKLLDYLASRFHYHPTLWSYALYHKDDPRLRPFVAHSAIARQCGRWLNSPLLDLEPIDRGWYEQLEYAPLVNARAHRLGSDRRILNDRLRGQYLNLLETLKYKPVLDQQDLLATTYYLFLQDRIEEGLAFFEKLDRADLHEKLQYDYLAAYAAFYRNDVPAAKAIAAKHEEHPAERWRKLFAQVGAQVAEIEKGAAPEVIDEDDREQKQDELADTEPTFSFTIEDGSLRLAHRNLKEARINYYPMEVELLFSRRPFVKDEAEQFTFVSPNGSETVKLNADKESTTHAIPAKYAGANVMVEVEAGGFRKSMAYYANSLRTELTEEYGRLRILDEKNRKPLPGAYVKVYARMKDGRVKFYKDGYADLRGKFDYVSLSTTELDRVQRFSLLVLHDEAGALIQEAKPPRQ